MIGVSEGPGGIAFANYDVAVRVGTIYLVLILLDGGMNAPWGLVRRVILPAGLLATIGVALTAGLVAVFARWLGLAWTEALLLGAVVSSTDAAAVLAVLRGSRLRLQPRLGSTLEVESCINDPMAVILTVTMIEVAKSSDALRWSLVASVPLQLAVGAAIGVFLGYVGMSLFRRVRLPTVGLYPALTLALAFLSFGVATLLEGSGLMSVYFTALVLGNSPLPYRSGLIRVHEALAWLSQIALFLMLGLLVYPSQLPSVAGVGLAVALFLAFVARPIAVFACLAPLRFPLRDMGYLGWIGLRGAVPIILGAFPVLAQVPGADHVFNIVFFIVVVSSLLPGAPLRQPPRWLGLGIRDKPAPSAVLEIHSVCPLNAEITSFLIEPAASVCEAALSEIQLPADAAVTLIVRGNELVPAKGRTVLSEGDHVYVFYRPEDRGYIELLFGRSEDV